MSGKQFLLLLLFFAAYLMLGATLFHWIEQAREIAEKEEQRKEAEIINYVLRSSCNDSSLPSLINQLEAYCDKTFKIDRNHPDPYKWHFYNAVFFVITVVSTIGYGNLAPTCAVSRILMIFYGLVGIPINGILLKSLADYFAHFFLRARDKYARHQNGMSLAGSILFYFSLGFVVFIVCPSVLFVHFEEWTYDEAMYYAFVSLSTVGFGDLVAGQDDEKTLAYTFYKVFLILWLVFGLGYLLMVLGFITDAMRSKKMAKLAKQTQKKVWHGFVHEMGYLRRVLNELYLLKVKPVYHDDDVSLVTLQMGDRSSSCPDLRWLGMDSVGAWPSAPPGLPGSRRPSRAPAAPGCRPRAFSEVLPGRVMLRRRRSEAELSRIDRRATFADTAPPADANLDPAELLHEFMNALVNWGGGGGGGGAPDDAYMAPPGAALPNGGYQGFADADILSSEQQMRARQLRQRAKSLAPFSAAAGALAGAQYAHQAPPRYEEDWDDSETLAADDADQDAAMNNAEWTWSGAAASKRVHELIRARQNRRRSEAAVRKQQRQDRRLQELHDFQRLQQLQEMRHLQKKLRTRTKSSSAVTSAEPGGVFQPRSSTAGFMKRLKEYGRRMSLQPNAAPNDGGGAGAAFPETYNTAMLPPWPTPAAKRRSPSYDPAAPPFLSANPYRTHSAGDNVMQATFTGGAGAAGTARRDSIFRRNSATVHPMLENTSLAEFLRVLQSVQRQAGQVGSTPPSAQSTMPAMPAMPTPGKTRKLGTAGLSPPHGPPAPTIFNVFPDLPGWAERRRSSLRPAAPSSTQDAQHAQGNGKRRMSFWPSFGSDSAERAEPRLSVSGAAMAGQRRKSSAARKLSTLFGGGTCTDPAPEHDDDGVEATDEVIKPIKKRRFVIWPTLGVIGKGGGGDGKDAAGGLGAAEAGQAGRADAPPLRAPPPEITISYASDVPAPPVPAPREALRRLALTSNLVTTNVPALVPSPTTLPVPGGPGRRAPSMPSASPSSGTSFRRRALSESTRTRVTLQQQRRDQRNSDSESFSEHL